MFLKILPLFIETKLKLSVKQHLSLSCISLLGDHVVEYILYIYISVNSLSLSLKSFVSCWICDS